MDCKHNYPCCSFSLSFCIYKETCLHKGLSPDFMQLDLKAKCPDSGPCLSQKRVDDAWDMEGFLYMKKMFILRECGYWRSHAGTGITPNKIS